MRYELQPCGPQPQPVWSQPGLAEGEAVAASGVAGTGGVAVHVVARAAAVRGIVGLPPPADHSVGGAGIGAGDRAAELGEARAAGAAAAAPGVAALADGAVGRARPQGEVEAGADGHGAADEGGAVDQAAPGEPIVQEARGAGHHRPGQAHGADVPRAATGCTRRRAPFERGERREREEGQPEPDRVTKSSGTPVQGWCASSVAMEPPLGRRRRQRPRRRPTRGRRRRGHAWPACRVGRSSRRWPASRPVPGRRRRRARTHA